jgi:thioredoxin reductase (NADPH)
MFVVLKGALTMSARDGLGRTAQVVRDGPGQFTGAVAQLSNGVAVVDADAEDDVEALLISPDRLHALIVAEAELGERIVRALILRRVAHIESGGSGPVLIGDLQSPDMLRLENFLRRNTSPRFARWRHRPGRVHLWKARLRLVAFARRGTLALSMRAESTSRPDVSSS